MLRELVPADLLKIQNANDWKRSIVAAYNQDAGKLLYLKFCCSLLSYWSEMKVDLVLSQSHVKCATDSKLIHLNLDFMYLTYSLSLILYTVLSVPPKLL
jgi:hypothetical protein